MTLIKNYNKMEDSNDIYDERKHELDLFSRNWNRAVEPIKKDAFREGIEAGKEKTFQNGFDEGYTNGFKAGLSIGHYNAILKTLTSHKFEMPLDLDVDCSNLTTVDNPTRGLCHLCTDSGKLLSKSEIESNVDKNMHLPIEEIVAKQTSVVENTLEAKRKLPDYIKVITSLDLEIR